MCIRDRYYDATLDYTAVLEMCFSVSLIKGNYDTSTKLLSGGGTAFQGNNFGYYITSTGDASGTYSVLQNYSSGDSSSPCGTAPHRETTVQVQCQDSGHTACAGGSSCTLNSAGYCVCGLTQLSDCAYQLQIQVQCDVETDKEKLKSHLGYVYMFGFGVFAYVLGTKR
eukprot:TRINITY_DN7891_c0_g1_i2.p1 TRINITY_DN7891_c0_g1~~TRINITY_DN7891_c0_g1_i2.p1  ORF type:complete len:168 (-),score=36.45 TRINITY_DN7891_c0_g1_i2:108-611(-)